jgi:hypothetical protein
MMFLTRCLLLFIHTEFYFRPGTIDTCLIAHRPDIDGADQPAALTPSDFAPDD